MINSATKMENLQNALERFARENALSLKDARTFYNKMLQVERHLEGLYPDAVITVRYSHATTFGILARVQHSDKVLRFDAYVSKSGHVNLIDVR